MDRHDLYAHAECFAVFCQLGLLKLDGRKGLLGIGRWVGSVGDFEVGDCILFNSQVADEDLSAIEGKGLRARDARYIKCLTDAMIILVARVCPAVIRASLLSGAINSIVKLLNKTGSRAASITMLGKTVELCGTDVRLWEGGKDL